MPYHGRLARVDRVRIASRNGKDLCTNALHVIVKLRAAGTSRPSPGFQKVYCIDIEIFVATLSCAKSMYWPSRLQKILANGTTGVRRNRLRSVEWFSGSFTQTFRVPYMAL